MSYIKKINGHDIKDDIARDLTNMMYENFESMVDEFKDIKAEVQDIERIIDEKLDDDLLGKIDELLESKLDVIVGEAMQKEFNEALRDVTNDVDANTSAINKILTAVDTPPTYTKPSISLSVSPTSVVHNITTNVTLKLSYTQKDGGSVTKVRIYRNNSLIHTMNSLADYTDTVTLNHGDSNYYRVEVDYAQGPIKTTLMGVDYPTGRIESGTITCSNQSIYCYGQTYYGVISDNFSNNVITTLNVTSNTNRNGAYTFNLTSQRVVYMYPSSFGDLTSIKDSNGFEYIHSYQKITTTYNNIDYNVYYLKDTVTITDFQQIYK